MIAITVTTAGRAADWSHTVSGSLNGSAVSNPGLEQDARGWDRSASLIMNEHTMAQTERLSFSLTPQFSATRYAHESDLNSDSGSAQGSLAWNFERGQWTLNAQGAVDTTLTSEPGRTGIIAPNRRHEVFGLSQVLTVSSNERLSWNAVGAWGTTRYPDSLDLGLTDYQNASLQVGPTWSFAPAVSGGLNVSVDALNSAGARRENTYSANARLGGSASERLSWQAQAGATRVNSAAGSSVSEVYALSASLQGEPVAWSLSVSRAVSPVGFGSFTLGDQVSLAASMGISTASSASLSLGYVRSEPVGVQPVASYRGATWLQLGLQWRWQFAQRWTATAGGGLARARSGGIDAWAESRRFQLGVQWQSDRL